ncbi:MAG: hypothetical protein MUO37_05240 [Methyloceanibacter sp.]|nr:hypothetical protein [Methyloceanibacter sp.]
MFIFLISLPSYGQHHIFSGTFSANDMAFGIRCDYKFKENTSLHYGTVFTDLGFYMGVGKGSYVSYEVGHINHLEINAGVMKYIRNNNGVTTNTFGLGLSYNDYKVIEQGWNKLPNNILFPVSLKLNAGYIVYRFNFGLSYDPIKKGIIINFGRVF